jgi:hypothetical protein
MEATDADPKWDTTEDEQSMLRRVGWDALVTATFGGFFASIPGSLRGFEIDEEHGVVRVMAGIEYAADDPDEDHLIKIDVGLIDLDSIRAGCPPNQAVIACIQCGSSSMTQVHEWRRCRDCNITHERNLR